MTKSEYNTYFNRNIRKRFLSWIGQKVEIGDDAVADSKIPNSIGVLNDIWYDEVMDGKFLDIAYVTVDGTVYIVALHEIALVSEKLIGNKSKGAREILLSLGFIESPTNPGWFGHHEVHNDFPIDSRLFADVNGFIYYFYNHAFRQGVGVGERTMQDEIREGFLNLLGMKK